MMARNAHTEEPVNDTGNALTNTTVEAEEQDRCKDALAKMLEKVSGKLYDADWYREYLLRLQEVENNGVTEEKKFGYGSITHANLTPKEFRDAFLRGAPARILGRVDPNVANNGSNNPPYEVYMDIPGMGYLNLSEKLGWSVDFLKELAQTAYRFILIYVNEIIDLEKFCDFKGSSTCKGHHSFVIMQNGKNVNYNLWFEVVNMENKISIDMSAYAK